MRPLRSLRFALLALVLPAAFPAGAGAAYDYVGGFGGPGMANGLFSAPSGLDLAGGSLYVADRFNSRIQKLDAGSGSLGAFQSTFGTPGSTAGDASFSAQVQGLATMANGDLAIADSGNNRVKLMTTAGAHVETIGTNVAGTTGGLFNFPVATAVGSGGSVYVAESANHRVQQLAANGDFLRLWGRDVGGTGVHVCTSAPSCTAGAQAQFVNGGFRNPTGVATDVAGNVYVYDFRRIQKFDSVGNHLLSIPPDQLPGWGALTIDPQGRILATRTGDAAVFDSSGAFLESFGGPELVSPADIALDGAGNIFVSDSDTDRIEVYRRQGTGGEPPVIVTPPSGGGKPTLTPGTTTVGDTVTVVTALTDGRNGFLVVTTRLPGPGRLTAQVQSQLILLAQAAKRKAKRKRITIASKTVSVKKAGPLKLTLKPKKQAKKILEAKGKLKGTLTLTYTPTGGKPKTVKRSVTFKLEPRKKKQKKR